MSSGSATGATKSAQASWENSSSLLPDRGKRTEDSTLPTHLSSSCRGIEPDTPAGGAMNIFVFGSSIASCYWNGAATYYRGIYKQLHAHGHRITFAEPDAYGRQQKLD